MKPSPICTLLAALSIPWFAAAQTSQTPARLSLPNNPDAKWLPEVDPLPSPDVSAAPLAAAGDAPTAPAAAAPTASAVPDAPAPTAAASPEQAGGAGIRMNFQGAQLSTVLNYLSEAAGFVIVQEVPVTGTVNIVSRQPISPDEAVDLLNAVLVEKNLLALRTGRILKIVSRTDAQKRDLPVITGSDPTLIPKKDNMVTQILPVRYADVSKLIDNLRPLLSNDAAISANDASNAILLTDTQTHIRRMAEIIRALDTSISGISTIHVFPLRYADAKSLASVLTQLFEPQQTSGNTGGRGGGGGGGGFPGFGGFGGFGGGRGGGGGNATTAQPQSEARKAASRVVAVADDQSNSIIVSAPDEYMATIAEVVSRLDTSVTDVTETRIFRLLHADATELSGILTSLYSDTSTTSQQTGGRNNQNRRGGGQQGPQQQQANTQPSERALQEARMVAVADPRTNSVIISASHDTMDEVALTIGRLDASDAKKQHVHVYTLENADPDNVASILRGMFTVDSSSSSTQSTTSVLSQRTTNGASSDITNTLNTSGTGNTGARNR